jgi:Spy/CpxP family protein refolding chaperone
MNQPWKLVLLLTGIFVAGGVTGAFVGMKVLQARVAQRPGPEQWAPWHLKRLAERLDLKPEQQEELKPIIKRNMDELNRLRAYSMNETRTVFERMNREISEKLTPEQRATFEQQNQEFRERAKKFGFGQGGPRGEKGERPPGGPDHPPIGPEKDKAPAPGDKPPPDKPPGN